MKLNYKDWKRQVQIVYRDKPGQRFINFYRRRGKPNEEFRKSAAYIAFALILIVGGGIIGIAPGIPAVFFVLAGLIIIASRLKFAAWLMDEAEIRIRYFLDQLMKGH